MAASNPAITSSSIMPAPPPHSVIDLPDRPGFPDVEQAEQRQCQQRRPHQVAGAASIVDHHAGHLVPDDAPDDRARRGGARSRRRSRRRRPTPARVAHAAAATAQLQHEQRERESDERAEGTRRDRRESGTEAQCEQVHGLAQRGAECACVPFRARALVGSAGEVVIAACRHRFDAPVAQAAHAGPGNDRRRCDAPRSRPACRRFDARAPHRRPAT